MDDPLSHDAVHSPTHYTHVPNVECIDVVEHFSFLRGSALKYLWRAGRKDDARPDLEKARWCIDRELAKLGAPRHTGTPGELTAAVAHLRTLVREDRPTGADTSTDPSEAVVHRGQLVALDVPAAELRLVLDAVLAGRR